MRGTRQEHRKPLILRTIAIAACTLTISGCTRDLTFKAIDSQTSLPVANVHVRHSDLHYSWHEFLKGFLMPDLVSPDVVTELDQGDAAADGLVHFCGTRFDVGEFQFSFKDDPLHSTVAHWDGASGHWLISTWNGFLTDTPAQEKAGVIVVRMIRCWSEQSAVEPPPFPRAQTQP